MGFLTHRPHQIQCPKYASRDHEADEVCHQIPGITAPSGEKQALSSFQKNRQNHPSTEHPPPRVATSSASVAAFSEGNQGRSTENGKEPRVQHNVHAPVHPPFMGPEFTSWHGVQGDHRHPHPQRGKGATPAGLTPGLSRPPRHRPRRSEDGPYRPLLPL